MSSTISVFINGSIEVSQIVGIVSKLCSCEFVDRTERVGNTLFESDFNGVWISVFDEHGLDDDCGIPFSKFEIELDLTSSGEFSGVKSIAIQIGRAIQSETASNVIIVENFQNIVPLDPLENS